MREYLLYVKEEVQVSSTYITPCFEVDKLFWQQQNGSRLHIIGTIPSLAIAFSIREKVNEYLKAHAVDDQSLSQIRRIANAFVREANVLYGREATGVAACDDGNWFHFHAYSNSNERDIDIEPIEIEYHPAFFEEEAEKVLSLIAGRALLWDELESFVTKKGTPTIALMQLLQWLFLRGLLEWLPGIKIAVQKGWIKHRLQLSCERCGEKNSICYTFCHTCGQGCAFCSACLNMGRSKCCTPYLCVPAALVSQKSQIETPILHWNGTFSPAQAEAAEKARLYAKSNNDEHEFLLWAVCGAGKTELLFPAIEQTLSEGNQVLLATPRKDVVLELVPRLKKVFPTSKVIEVHSSSEEKWEEGDLFVATTHQVMRFYRKFPLVIVDEVDAFPYHNNESLYRAVSRAVISSGKLLYLSATPPSYLRKRLVSGSICGGLSNCSSTHVMLPKRYHGHPLPVPKNCLIPALNHKLKRCLPITVLQDTISKSFKQERQVFVFVPRIEDVPVILRYFQTLMPECAASMEGVHAADPDREEKVRRFRDKIYTLLVTTTILERGVTIPRSDVIVLGANAPVFDEASLVQIAGRVGRSADSYDGTVLFCMDYRTKAPSSAIKQIKRMNRLAASLGKDGRADVC